MTRKRKFRPKIFRIKLNPEQAVLTCDCFDLTSHFITQTASVLPGAIPNTIVCVGPTQPKAYDGVYHVTDLDSLGSSPQSIRVALPTTATSS